MDAPNERSSLQIFEDVTFQQRTWKGERCGWVGLGAIVIAALFGLFGGGWIGRAAISAESGRLSLEYDRFWRVQSPTVLKLEVSPLRADGDRVRVWIGREYVESMSVSQIMPRPVRVEGGGDRFVFEFATHGGGGAIGVVFRFEPERAWRVNGAIGLEDGEPLRFTQFIFP